MGEKVKKAAKTPEFQPRMDTDEHGWGMEVERGQEVGKGRSKED